MGRFYFDFEFLSVYFSHSLHFSKGDSVSVVETVLFLFVEADKSFLFLGDSSDVDGFSLLSSCIENPVRVSEIDKSITIEP